MTTPDTLRTPLQGTGRTDRIDRLYALDNLRALMMWLGIVLHVCVIYLTVASPIPWRDNQTSRWADLLTAFIHSLRMPVFFMLAGFFVLMLVEKRGEKGMLHNRLRRLALPFAIFWPPLFAACALLALLFMNRMARGVWGLDPSAMPRNINDSGSHATMHLWFLWMLIWFCAATVPVVRLARRLPERVVAVLDDAFARIAATPWGIVLLTLPLAFIGSFYRDGFLQASGDFLPPAAEWLHNGLFFAFGLGLYRHRDVLLPLYMRRWKWLAMAGLAFFIATLALVQTHNALLIAFTYNAVAWLWGFALTGAFLRHLDTQRGWLSYLADSSYWVYLVHMPLTIGIGALLYGLPLPAMLKVLINICATTAVCLASYHLFVRFTAVSTLLTGRRHHRNKTPGEMAHAT